MLIILNRSSLCTLSVLRFDRGTFCLEKKKTGQAVLPGGEVPGEEQSAGSDDGVDAPTRLRGTFAGAAGAAAAHRRHLAGLHRCLLSREAEAGRQAGALLKTPPPDVLHAHSTAGPKCI